MAFGKRNEEEIVIEETKIWECTSEQCNGWMRDNFKSSEEPLCPLCKSEMRETTKMLEVVHNYSKNFV